MSCERIRSILKPAIAVLSIASFTGQSWAGGLTTIASFNGTNGANPSLNGVTVDAQGNLFGATYGGGANGGGTVWEIAIGTNTINALASFNSANGAYPYDGVILDAQGNLYGATVDGGANNDGTVFEIAKGSGTITTLVSFDGTNGQAPRGLTMDASGNLYGVTAVGGANDFRHGVRDRQGDAARSPPSPTFNGSNGNRSAGGV